MERLEVALQGLATHSTLQQYSETINAQGLKDIQDRLGNVEAQLGQRAGYLHAGNPPTCGCLF